MARLSGWFLRLALAVAMLGCLAAAPAAKPLSVEDILARESIGAVEVASNGRWLLWERRAAYASGSRFDFDRFNDLFRTRIEIVDLDRPAEPQALKGQSAGAGYALGPISPDGARAVVYRLEPDAFTLGVASLQSRDIRWFPIIPDLPSWGAGVQWLSPTELVLIALHPGTLPYDILWTRPQARMTELWDAAAAGRATPMAYGAGRYIGARARTPPKRLLRLRVTDGRAEELARGDFTDLEIAPDRRRIALFEAAEDIPLRAGIEVQGDQGIAIRRNRLSVFDLTRGRLVRAASHLDMLTHLLAWSPTSEDVLVYARHDGEPWSAGELLRVCASTGAQTPLPFPAAKLVARRRPEVVWAGWLGPRPTVWAEVGGEGGWHLWAGSGWRPLAGPPGKPSALASVDQGELLTQAHAAVWALAPGRRARRVCEDCRPPPSRAVGLSGRLAARLRTGPVDRISGQRLVRLGARGVQRALKVPADSEPVVFAGARGALVRRTVGGGREDWVWVGAGQQVLLATLNARLEQVKRPCLRPIEHQLGDERLVSWLAFPCSGDLRRPPPLVVVPYPGRTYGTTAPASVDPARAGEDATPALLVAHGYAVLLPSLPAPTAPEGPGEGLADAVLQIIDAAAADPRLRNRFDPERLAVWGHSFGGYGALVLISQTSRFKAAVAAAAPSNFIGLHGEFGPNRRVAPDEGLSTPFTTGWVETLQGGMKGPPWEAPQRYAAASPLLSADKIATPLMLIHGDLDGFPLGQAEQMFSALFRQNKDVLLLTYWGEGHTLRSPGNIRDMQSRALAWLDDHLAFSGPGPHPARPGSGPASSAPKPPPPPR